MSNDLYQNIIDNSPDFVFESRVDNFQFTKVNKRACEFYGYSHTEFMNMNIFDIEVNPPVKKQVRQLYDNTPIGSVIEVFGSNKKKDGTIFPVHVRFSKINEEFAIANVRDITELKETQNALDESHELSKALLNATTESSLLVEPNGKVLELNEMAARRFGKSATELTGKNIFDIMPEKLAKSRFKVALEVVESGKPAYFEDERDGMFFSNTVYPVFNMKGKVTKLAIYAHDITDEKKVKETLKRSHDELESLVEKRTQKLRALASRLESIREEERINISRKIHDELGHSLTGIQFDIQSLRKSPELQNKKVSHELNSINKLVYQSLETIKEIATDLRPGVLDKLGLDAAIEWQLSQFRTRTKIKCKQNIEDLPSEISNTITTTIFRIFQEILTNIIRHSQADKVMVILKIDHNDIVLNVRDNGIGIKEGDLGNINSLGLLGMQERVNMVGGSFNIARVKKGGTEVKISIPV